MGRIRGALTIVALLIMTINADAWPWISPYAYCFNNPIKFIDPDGRVVHPTDNSAFAILLNTLSPVDREYVVLNGYGNIDYGTMQSRDRRFSGHDYRNTSRDHNDLLRKNIRRSRMETVSYFK